MYNTRTLLMTSAIGLFLAFGPAYAQVSGVPGDGIPDFYYFPADGLIATTSLGPITRPAGMLTVDTDGTDMVVVLVGGPNGLPNCDLCDGGSLPDPAAPPPQNASSWVAGFINNSTQWVRINPLTTPGFMGVIGEYADPFNIFPDFGLSNYGPGLTDADFLRVFDDPNGELWSVLYATNSGGQVYTNVTIVEMGPTPVEPASWSRIKSLMR